MCAKKNYKPISPKGEPLTVEKYRELPGSQPSDEQAA